ncbi:hypothetical protein Tco_0493932 [Tanacetum coccineum]
MDVAIRNQGASIKTLETQIGQMSKLLQESRFGSLPSSTETNPRDQVKSILTTIEADASSIRRIGSNQYVVSTGENSILLYKSRQATIPFLSHLDNHYCEEEEGSYGPKFTEAYGALNVYDTIPQKEKDLGSFTLPCYINDFCFDNSLVDLGASVNRIVKYLKGIAENVLVGIGKFTFPVDFIILDMPEDIKVPLILGRPFFLRERMELDLEARLMGETLVLNRSLDSFLKDYIELNDLNEPFELRRNQGDDLIPTVEEGEVIEEFRTRVEDLDTGIDDYPILEDMDAYRDNEMGDVICGEPLLRDVGIKTKWFKGIITLYNGKRERCKEWNLACIPKLKGFYKGVLNLGPDYIRDAKMEEWLTRGHISVHELEE